jgi:hypothetical protein
MAAKRKRSRPKKPRFPRRQWLPGQAPRVEKPKKGKGSYDRNREDRALRKDVEKEVGEG